MGILFQIHDALDKGEPVRLGAKNMNHLRRNHPRHHRHGLPAARWRAGLVGIVSINALVCLLAVDAVLIVLHVLTGMFMEKIPPALNIAMDRSLAEWFGYAKLACAALLLWLAYRASRIPVLFSFVVIFVAMAADDSLELHENLGGWIADVLPPLGAAGWREQDFGELLMLGAMGVMLLPVLVFGAVKTLPQDRSTGLGLAIGAALLAVFAIGVDAVHGPACSAVAEVPYCFQFLDLVEDGGEMIAQSLILAHVVVVYRAKRHAGAARAVSGIRPVAMPPLGAKATVPTRRGL